MPTAGFSQALFLTGRRSGKKFGMAAVIAAFEAALTETRETRLAKGEKGVVAVVSPTKGQSKVVKDYIRGCLKPTRSRLRESTTPGFLPSAKWRPHSNHGWRLSHGASVSASALASMMKIAAYLRLSRKMKVPRCRKRIRAVEAGLPTTGGKFIAISSPYARKGWCFSTHQKNFGNDRGRTLVWNAPSRVMNETLPQSVVDEALAEDLQAAKAGISRRVSGTSFMVPWNERFLRAWLCGGVRFLTIHVTVIPPSPT